MERQDASWPLLQHVREHLSLLTQEVVGQVERSEVDGEFPFDRLNDLRAYMNFAPYYFSDFAAAFKGSLQAVARSEVASALGTSTRMRRYFLLLVIGAYLKSEGNVENDGIAVLRELIAVARNRVPQEARHLDLLQGALRPVRGGDLAAWQPSAAIKLCGKLRQFVDLVFLGEHPLGYQAFLPPQAAESLGLIRQFWRLDEGGFLSHPQEVSVIYLLGTGSAHSRIDPFTGEADPLPSQRDVRSMYVIADGDFVGEEMGERLCAAVDDAMVMCSGTQARLGASALEVRKMQVFSSEAIALSCLARQDLSWSPEVTRAIESGRTSTMLKSELRARTYTETYFRLLRRSMEWVERSLSAS